MEFIHGTGKEENGWIPLDGRVIQVHHIYCRFISNLMLPLIWQEVLLRSLKVGISVIVHTDTYKAKFVIIYLFS